MISREVAIQKDDDRESLLIEIDMLRTEKLALQSRIKSLEQQASKVDFILAFLSIL